LSSKHHNGVSLRRTPYFKILEEYQKSTDILQGFSLFFKDIFKNS